MLSHANKYGHLDITIVNDIFEPNNIFLFVSSQYIFHQVQN